MGETGRSRYSRGDEHPFETKREENHYGIERSHPLDEVC